MVAAAVRVPLRESRRDLRARRVGFVWRGKGSTLVWRCSFARSHMDRSGRYCRPIAFTRAAEAKCRDLCKRETSDASDPVQNRSYKGV